MTEPSDPDDSIFEQPERKGWRVAGAKFKSAVIAAVAVVVLGGAILYNNLSDLGLVSTGNKEGSAVDKARCAEQFQWVSSGGSPEGLGASFRIMLSAEDAELKRLGEAGGTKLIAAVASPGPDPGTGVPPGLAALFEVYNDIGNRCQELSPDYRRQMDAYCKTSGTCKRS